MCQLIEERKPTHNLHQIHQDDDQRLYDEDFKTYIEQVLNQLPKILQISNRKKSHKIKKRSSGIEIQSIRTLPK